MSKATILIEQEKCTLAFSQPYIFLEGSLSEKLIEKGFIKPTDGHLIVRIGPDGRQSPARRWTRENTEVVYEPERSFLSCEGTIVSEMALAFSDIRKASEDLLGESFKSKLKWAEILIVSRAVGSKYPLKVIGAKFQNDNAKSIGRIFGFDLSTMSIGLYSAKGDETLPLNQIPNWVHVAVEPFVLNPNYYFIRIVCRQTDVNKVEAFGKELQGMMDQLLINLEN